MATVEDAAESAGGPPEEVIKRSRLASRAAWPRAFAGVLGIWLFLSAFSWPHETVHLVNHVVCAVITVVVTIVSVRLPVVRFINSFVGLWLVISALVFDSASIATPWNGVFVGVLLIGATMMPSHGATVHWPRTRFA